MGWVDLDVIAKPQNKVGGVTDKRLAYFQSYLENHHALARAYDTAGELAVRKVLIKDVVNVKDMVDRITSSLGGDRIRRLRLFGHGSPQTVQMGPEGWADLAATISGRLTQAEEYRLLNEPYLAQLSGHFAPGAWVELHACRVIAPKGLGNDLIQALANLWNVGVQAADARQFLGGGLEGNVWQARPGGRNVEMIRAQPPEESSGCNASARRIPGQTSPLRQALDSLSVVGHHGVINPLYEAQRTRRTWIREACESLKSLFGGQRIFDGVSTLAPRRVEAFSHSETGTLRQVFGSLKPKPAATNHVGPSGAAAMRAQHDRMAAAIAGALGPRPTVVRHMPPGTGYSLMGTRKSYVVDASGRHLEMGAHKEQSGLGSSRFAIESRNHSLREALNRLEPRPTTIRQHMLPGTEYSNIRTGKSYVIGASGRPVETGAFKNRTALQTFSRQLLATNARTNPLLAVLRKPFG
jgi:hypothetical protein